jgi:DNA-binding response OmpR family regulator
LITSEEVFLTWMDRDTTLTPVERRIMRELGLRLGSWLPVVGIARAVYRDTEPGLLEADRATLRTHIWRMRHKFAKHGDPWQIENRYPHGLYRLVYVA